MLGRIIFTMLTVSLLVSGCTHSRPPLSISNETFTTKITENGIKLFVYQFDMEMPGGNHGKSGGRPPSGGQRGPGGAGGNGGPGGPSMYGGGRGDDQEDDGDDEINILLSKKLKENSFCRNGYIELDRYLLYTGAIKIRGECEEGATTADRKAFPNS